MLYAMLLLRNAVGPKKFAASERERPFDDNQKTCVLPCKAATSNDVDVTKFGIKDEMMPFRRCLCLNQKYRDYTNSKK